MSDQDRFEKRSRALQVMTELKEAIIYSTLLHQLLSEDPEILAAGELFIEALKKSNTMQKLIS